MFPSLNTRGSLTLTNATNQTPLLATVDGFPVPLNDVIIRVKFRPRVFPGSLASETGKRR